MRSDQARLLSNSFARFGMRQFYPAPPAGQGRGRDSPAGCASEAEIHPDDVAVHLDLVAAVPLGEDSPRLGEHPARAGAVERLVLVLAAAHVEAVAAAAGLQLRAGVA